MTHWQDLMPSASLVPGGVLSVTWEGDDLLLYRTALGECRAMTAYCPHMGNYIPNGLAPKQALSALLVDGELCCPFHGWRFNHNGRCTHIPQGQHVPKAIRMGRPVAQCWQIREKDNQIQIASP